jgi:Flp pilus assembly protein TadG
MRVLKDESGQVLVLAALCLTVLLGVMALAIDVGYMHYRQVQLQTAADSAAIAAGLELGNCSKTVCTNMKTAAAQALIEDGITSTTITPTSSCTVSTSTGLAMIINVAPCALGSPDPNYGNTNMAEVVLTEPQSTFFGPIFGLNIFNLVARSEAGEAYYLDSGGGNCIYTKSLSFNGGDGIFDLKGCGIYDNGNLQTNSSDGVTASTFLYYGTWSPNNCNNSCTWTLGNSETGPTHTTTAQADPLAGVTAPSQPANSPTYTDTTPPTGTTLSPGYYPNGFNLNSNVTVNLTPGLYYFNSSVNVNSGATLECTTCTGGAGVTLYFANGTLQPNGAANIELTAPSVSGDTTGTILSGGAGAVNMLIWESTSNSSGMTVDGGSSSYFNGVIYLPDGQLTLNSASNVTINSSSGASAIDAKSIIVDSNQDFVINGSGGYLGGVTKVLGSFAVAE